MAEKGGGAVVIVSSIAGLKGSKVLGAYGISKAADTVTIDGASRARFAELSSSAKTQLDLAESMAGGRAQAE